MILIFTIPILFPREKNGDSELLYWTKILEKCGSGIEEHHTHDHHQGNDGPKYPDAFLKFFLK